MKIQGFISPLWFFLFLAPLILIWSINIFVLNGDGDRVLKFWEASYISLIAGLFIVIQNLQKITVSPESKEALSLFKYLVYLFLIGFISTYLSDSLSYFTIKTFVQELLLLFSVGVSLFVGTQTFKQEKYAKILKYCVIIAILVASANLLITSFREPILNIIFKRPFTLSFYFLPIFCFFLVHFFKDNKILNTILIISILLLTFLSGSRSGLIILIPLILFYISGYRKIIFLLIALSLFFVSELNMIFPNKVLSKSRISSVESPREFIWERVIEKIKNQENYLIGNGLVTPDFSTHIEEIHSAHNTYLQLFYMYGIVGLIISIFYLFKILALFSYFNKLFALAFLGITWVNDISLFPFDFSRIYEYMFLYFFIGTLISWKIKKFS